MTLSVHMGLRWWHQPWDARECAGPEIDAVEGKRRTLAEDTLPVVPSPPLNGSLRSAQRPWKRVLVLQMATNRFFFSILPVQTILFVCIRVNLILPQVYQRSEFVPHYMGELSTLYGLPIQRPLFKRIFLTTLLSHRQ